jgi:diguanylate cyclase (GGDEF)-like protein/PAS domain S-box-containing protein
MTAAAPRFPLRLRWAFALGLLGIALTAPFSAPDGTGMQWDELVLASIAGFTGLSILRVLRTMDPAAARPWRFVSVGAFLFMGAQLAAGLFPGPEFDNFGIDDVVLFVGAITPLITCGLLATRVIRTRWTTLFIDGMRAAVALFLVCDLLLAHPIREAFGSGETHSLVLAYGAYAAIILGSAGALCTVATATLRRSASTMIWANVWMASGAIWEALAIVWPSAAWTFCSDVTVILALLTTLLATTRAPLRFERSDVRASAPRVDAGGIVITVAAMLSLPVTLAVIVLRGQELQADGIIGCAVVLALSALRVVMRIREDGRITEDLVRHEEDFRGLVESSSDGVAIVDGDATVLFASPAARELLGITGVLDDDVVLPELVDLEDRPLVRAALERGDVPVLHFRVLAADGSRHEIEATSTERPGHDRRVLYLRDVTVRRRRERELERMAYTDHLTALPNRAQLFREMAQDAEDPDRSLLVVDLDGFKEVNDVAGHEAGDQLLVEVARRLHTVVRDDDLVTRLGGDEFAILVAGTLAEAVEVAERVVSALALPHRSGAHTFALGGSVGVARLGSAGGQVAFREADEALRAAKQAGKGCVRIADAVVAPPGSDAAVTTALADGSMRLRLDSACDGEGRIVVVHALPVWEHPDHGTVLGQEVWAAAERQGSSAELQSWLLHRACAAIAALDDDRLSVAVSLPAGYLSSDGLAAEVRDALTEAGLPAERLILSLTEETLLAATAGLVPELEAARAAGVRLCLDQYGMGHSIFALLARVPLDLVRVDLTALAVRDDMDRALHVLGVIARTTASFELTMIAGGVSTPELVTAALEAGVELVNGRACPHDLTVASLAALLAADAVPTTL